MSLPYNLDNVRKCPSMCLPVVSYDAAVAYVEGANAACDGGLLRGFREWLIVKFGGGNSLVWWALVLFLIFPESKNPLVEYDKFDDQQALIEQMYGLLDNFYEERQEKGLRRIYMDYEKWLRTQSWYKPGWPTWIDL